MPYSGPDNGTWRRFIIKNWSDTRKAIHALEVGGRRNFPASERSNACSSVQRLAAAYDFKRKWSIHNRRGGGFYVRRTK